MLVYSDEDYCNCNYRRLNSFDIDTGLIAAEKLSIVFIEESLPRKNEAEFAPKGFANMFCSEDFDLSPLSANYAYRRERRDRDRSDLLLPPAEKHANEELFFLWSKHFRTSSEDSIFFRESRASRIDTCLILRPSKNEFIEIALSDASSGMKSC